ncbi:MAG: cobalamin-binding protein [Flavobacteriales bacterium]|nr:cobalamin-binding protein [Flavobacteriales bacterium]
MNYYPERIVCLTEETTETLYLLGEQDRIVGISGFTVRPKQARKEKPKVSAFVDAKIDEILDLKPDLVIGFSDIQADIAKDLISKGITVWVNNHRSVDDIFKMMVQLGALVGKAKEALALVSHFQNRIQEIKTITSQWGIKPKVYFEEWYDPLISGIQWVNELIEIAGGEDVYKENSLESLAKNRIIEHQEEVIQKNPDIILASWCGKKFKPKKMLARKAWNEIKAIQDGEVYEIDSSIILQPGPASVSEGLEILHRIFHNWVKKQS